MKRLLMGLVTIMSFSAFAEVQESNVIKIDIKSLTVNSKCKDVKALQENLEPQGIKLLWEKCIKGQVREPGRYKKSIQYNYNPQLNGGELSDYLITEVEKSNGWEFALIGDKVAEYGFYELSRSNHAYKSLLKTSKPFGKVTTARRIGNEYIQMSGVSYRIRGINKTNQLNQLIQIAVDDYSRR